MSPEADLGRERPLLLAPCSPDIDPERHFRYDVTGEIHPQLAEDLRAQATIHICNLRRRRLRDDRARVIQRTVRLVQVLERLRARLGLGDSNTIELQQLLDEQVHDEALHAGAARHVLSDPGAFSRPAASRVESPDPKPWPTA